MATVKMPKKEKFEVEKKEIEILSGDEVKRIILAAQLCYKNGVLKLRNAWAIVLMIYTGMRMGEALALKWKNFDEKNKTIHIEKNISLETNRDDEGPRYRLVEHGFLKTTNSERDIPLSKMAFQAITELRKVSVGEYIISTREGSPVRPRNLQNMFDSLLTAAGVEHKGLHVTRHTFASILLAKDASLKYVSGLLGHNDIRTTANIYGHLQKGKKENVISLLD